MRNCSTCEAPTADADFYRRRERANPSSVCRQCARAKNRAGRLRILAKNPSWEKDRMAARRKNEAVNANDLRVQRQRYARSEEVRVKAKMCRDAYRESRVIATPAWADMSAIRSVYVEATAKDLHVDHIVPLKGRNVCGLHVSWNLQLLTAFENRSKLNRFAEAA